MADCKTFQLFWVTAVSHQICHIFESPPLLSCTFVPHSFDSCRPFDVRKTSAADWKNAFASELMAIQDDVIAEEATVASSAVDLDLEEGNVTLSKFIPPEESQDEEHATPSLFPSVPTPTSRRRLYLMVLADFGLSFAWLSKFAVAT